MDLVQIIFSFFILSLVTNPLIVHADNQESKQLSYSKRTTSCVISNEIDFVCTEKGRFQDPNDVTCTQYFLCSLLLNGTFIKTEYTCPEGSFFDDSINLCSVDYICPCTTTTTESTTISTTSTPTITTTSSDCIISDNFTCTERGRFRNPSDLTCTTYFLCSLLHNGTFIQTEYTCPEGSYFDESIHLCSVDYVCPCITTTTEITTSTTTSDCIISDNFTCTERGRFRNPSDWTCTTYFLCSLLHNGTFIQTEYTCPEGSYFDESIHLCSVDYVCPCITTTTEITTSTPTITTTTSDCIISDNFTCTERGRFRNPSDLTCTTYFLCSLLHNGTFIQTEYTCPENSYFDESIHLCSVDYVCPCITTTTEITTSTTSSDCIISDNFTCTERGRFRNPSDLTCTTYFLCSLLHNGTFIQTEYTCPEGSYFDESIHLCSVDYVCPCITTTTEITTSTTTTSDCIISDNFTCTERGRFRNPSDLTCTTYFLCSFLHNGTFIQTEYTCPESSYFDESIHLCSVDYVCPCITTTTEITTSTTTSDCIISDNFTCTERGRFRNPSDLTCTTYFLCSLLHNGTFIQTEYTCPEGSYFDESIHLCSVDYVCPCITTTTEITTSTTTSDCIISDNFTCTERGRFRNPSDLTCTTYFLCSLLHNGTFIQTEYTCPEGSYFDESIHLCSVDYVCPCITTTTEITTSTPTITTTTSDCIISDNFTCTERGRFRNPSDLTCTTYFLCSLLHNGTFIQTEYTCPEGSYFDESIHLCSVDYVCPCITTTTEITTSTTTSDCIISDNFTCTERGRFRNPSDLTCTTYFLCSLLHNGTFIQTEYNCPEGSYFDESIHLCSLDYVCPCITTTTEIITSTTNSDCIISDSFTCKERGRFRDPTDLTCTKYYLCSLTHNGTFIQTSYSCPNGSYFDESIHLCSIHYVCPCTVSTNYEF